MLERPSSAYIKKLVWIDLIGTLRAEHPYVFSRLQRTKLLSRKTTQDWNLVEIGCETSLYQLINVYNISFCLNFRFMFSKCREKCQKVWKFDDFCIFCYFNSRCAVSRYWQNELKFRQCYFFMSYQRNITQRNQFPETKKFGPPQSKVMLILRRGKCA